MGGVYNINLQVTCKLRLFTPPMYVRGSTRGQYIKTGSGPFLGPGPKGFPKAIRGTPGAKSGSRSGVRSGMKQPRFRDIFVTNSHSEVTAKCCNF